MAKQVVLALGSNLGNRRNWIIQALARISANQAMNLSNVSGIYESKALTLAGVDSTKPKYLNCVAQIETDLKPEQLLLALQKIEKDLGRKRKERWGDRNIDIDIIDYDHIKYTSATLALPHPQAQHRSFVIVPWYEMDEWAELQGYGRIERLAYIFSDQVTLK
jgi:2-amino-4-hydroxy-6-hydroxymethyldihydropteridine diphosphokinase